jgi:hypothetical protein
VAKRDYYEVLGCGRESGDQDIKAAYRELAQELGVPSAAKPASPCLASRVPYGTPVDPPTLARIDAAEQAVRALGFPVLRVRHHGELGKLELPEPDLSRALSDAGGSSYLARQAEKNPAAFMALIGRVLPLQVKDGGAEPQVQTVVQHIYQP